MIEQKPYYQRIKEFRKSKKMSLQEVADKVDLAKSTLSDFENGKSSVSTDNLILICRAIGADIGWVMTNKEYGTAEHKEFSEPPLTYQKKDNGMPLMITVDNAGDENIVLVNTKAQAGYPTHYLEPEYYRNLPSFKLPVARLRNGTFRAFEVSGPSMQPTFHQGAIVIGEFKENWHKGDIRDGYVYVVVTKEYVTVKRVLNRIAQGKLALMSDNEEFKTYQVPVEDVLQLWYVPGALLFQFPNPRYDERRKLAEIEARLLDLEDTLNLLNKNNPMHER
jgi:transcriptional regulator with XRE-family HTH domain